MSKFYWILDETYRKSVKFMELEFIEFLVNFTNLFTACTLLKFLTNLFRDIVSTDLNLGRNLKSYGLL